ncbi:ATP-binding protein [Rugosimonospora africana]|uniref:LuxR family transcriptional regulator n=1 Tax=Rugosimonospora africana TaxID=556532 RepID=A0A8J3VR46_9ACTN|nr:LuxR family transcriptional regulator [Rugosimonospora africana]GIH15717.1 LuxR family transcriptional regulator [Rugosimonospora africana]
MTEALLADSLVGRQRQLGRARGWVADLTAGRGQAGLIEGEPGIGKSSLLRALAGDAMAARCRVIWATCDELSRAFPLLPLLEAVQAQAGLAGDGPARIAEMLRAESMPGNRTDVVAAATERFLALMDDVCAREPVLLMVDDLQWADPATVIVLGRLVRSVRQLPLLVVGATRPVPLREDLLALRRAVDRDGGVVRLHSLSETETAELLAREVGGVPGTRLRALAQGAAGNPLYLIELVDALRRGGALATEDGCMDATGGSPPDSLAAAIADRLQFLSAPAREVLRVAALLGEEFSVSELAVASGRPVTDLLPALDEALLAGVVADKGKELAFRHPLIRSALYDVMPEAMRAAWHRDAARALTEDGAPVEQVARQLLPAADTFGDTGAMDEWMVRWLADAGHQLVGQAPNAAVSLLRWAVGAIPAGADPHDLLTCRLADALYSAGDTTAAAKVAGAALDRVTQPDLLVDLHWTLAPCRTREGRAEEALAELERTLHACDLETRERARLLVLTARIQRSLGRVSAASETAQEALSLATASGDRWARGWSLGMLSILHGMRGDPTGAIALFDRARAVAEGDPALVDLRLMLQLNHAAALGDLDRYDAAIGTAEQARQLADDAGNVVRLVQAQVVVGELLFDVGRWDDALAEVDLGSDPLPDPSVECNAHGLAATIQFHRGDATAARHLSEAERFATRLGQGRLFAPLAMARCLDREQSDNPNEALAGLMAELSGTTEQMEEAADLLADAVRLAMTVGDDDAARDVVRRAQAFSAASEVPHRKAVGPHCRGLLDRDPTQLVAAADHYRAANRLLPRAQALEAAAVALADGGDIAGARAYFTDAFALYSTLGAGWDLARTQATFRAYGIRRGPHSRHRRSQHGWDSLTPTELRIANLVAGGMSNPQIAAQLFLSRRTVQTHVSHVLAKLGLNSRIDIAREASQRNLTGPGQSESS